MTMTNARVAKLVPCAKRGNLKLKCSATTFIHHILTSSSAIFLGPVRHFFVFDNSCPLLDDTQSISAHHGLKNGNPFSQPFRLLKSALKHRTTLQNSDNANSMEMLLIEKKNLYSQSPSPSRTSSRSSRRASGASSPASLCTSSLSRTSSSTFLNRNGLFRSASPGTPRVNTLFRKLPSATLETFSVKGIKRFLSSKKQTAGTSGSSSSSGDRSKTPSRSVTPESSVGSSQSDISNGSIPDNLFQSPAAKIVENAFRAQRLSIVVPDTVDKSYVRSVMYQLLADGDRTKALEGTAQHSQLMGDVVTVGCMDRKDWEKRSYPIKYETQAFCNSPNVQTKRWPKVFWNDVALSVCVKRSNWQRGKNVKATLTDDLLQKMHDVTTTGSCSTASSLCPTVYVECTGTENNRIRFDVASQSPKTNAKHLSAFKLDAGPSPVTLKFIDNYYAKVTVKGEKIFVRPS